MSTDDEWIKYDEEKGVDMAPGTIVTVACIDSIGGWNESAEVDWRGHLRLTRKGYIIHSITHWKGPIIPTTLERVKAMEAEGALIVNDERETLRKLNKALHRISVIRRKMEAEELE